MTNVERLPYMMQSKAVCNCFFTFANSRPGVQLFRRRIVYIYFYGTQKLSFLIAFNYDLAGNTECCMLLLHHLENPLPANLSNELLNLCSPEMSTVMDFLTRQGIYNTVMNFE